MSGANKSNQVRKGKWLTFVVFFGKIRGILEEIIDGKQKERENMKKKEKNITFLGGADGPTSVFIASKKEKPDLRERLRRYRYKRKRARAEKRIQANSHTLDEVVKYMKHTFHARECRKESLNYTEEKKYLKESLILKHKPELLGELANVSAPEDYSEEALKKMWKKMEERTRMAEKIPEDKFPMDFHLYRIKIPGGSMDIIVEKHWEYFSYSCSGNKKAMHQLKKLAAELYLYYGVTEKDIAEKSERYSALVLALTE